MNVLLVALMISANLNMVERKTTKVIVLHHSAGINGSADSIRYDHIVDRKWEDGGYHFVIGNGNGSPDGEPEILRDLWRQGAHARRSSWGNMNPYSVGICLIGKDKFTTYQKETTIILVASLCTKYGLVPSRKTIRPHGTDCPGPGLDINDIIEKTKIMIQILERSNQKDPFKILRDKPKTLIVQNGDSLSAIGRRVGCNWVKLVELNPRFRINPNSIQIGDELIIP